MTWLPIPPTLLPPHLSPVSLLPPEPQPYLLLCETPRLIPALSLLMVPHNWNILPLVGLPSWPGACSNTAFSRRHLSVPGSAVPGKVEMTFPSPLAARVPTCASGPAIRHRVWSVRGERGLVVRGVHYSLASTAGVQTPVTMCIPRGRMRGAHRVRGWRFTARPGSRSSSLPQVSLGSISWTLSLGSFSSPPSNLSLTNHSPKLAK